MTETFTQRLEEGVRVWLCQKWHVCGPIPSSLWPGRRASGPPLQVHSALVPFNLVTEARPNQ